MIILVYSAQSEETIWTGLGQPDRGRYFARRAFRPLLARMGTVVELEEPEVEADAAHTLCRHQGEECLFLSFAPPHETVTGLGCPTVPVFALGYEDLPTEAWEDDPRNDWRTVLAEYGRAITHSSHAVEVVRRALGDDFPVVALPAPVWDAALGARPDRLPEAGFEIHLRGQVLDSRPEGASPGTALGEGRRNGAILRLSGIVYTAVLDPGDRRRNLPELLAAFVRALRDREDATLFLKLVTRPSSGWYMSLVRDLGRLTPFRCRVVATDSFLEDSEYRRLASHSTYAVSASRGEGQCMPLMELMSSGVPAIAPVHTGLCDYVDTSNAFVLRSSPEPAAWPQDPRGELRTSWHRVDSESLFEAYRESHRVARDEPERYRALATCARERLRSHCSLDVLEDRLRSFLEATVDRSA